MRLLTVLAVCLLFASTVRAGPWIDPGNSSLRNDIQVLADEGVISGPVSTWPLSTGDLLAALDADLTALSPAGRVALSRLRRHLDEAARIGDVKFLGRASATQHPREIRTFEDGPRETGEIGVGLEWTGERYAVRLQGQWVNDPDDNKDLRADDSYVGVALGNWMLAASTSQRYWGPGWQSSMLLSNNARPIPAFTLERNATTPFGSRWLSWIGSWDLAVMWGFLDDDRAVPNARVLGGRFNFRPLESLEIGISGLGLWCGSGNDCGLDEISDVVTGGGQSDEFDRVGGFDVRWSSRLFDVPFALYTHIVGEDFGDGGGRLIFPSKILGQFGAETWGYWDGVGNYRFFLEWADTECDFSLGRKLTGDGDGGKPGCAYRNSTYRSGETYRGKSFAHSFDQDSSIATLGSVLSTYDETSWTATLAGGKINRRGANLSTVAPNETDYWEVEIGHRRPFWIGEVHLGLSYEYRKDQVTDENDDDFRAFLEWRFAR